ncbi:MAG: glycosyl hydrolase family 65 protein [Burkholderiaceae bacterium]
MLGFHLRGDRLRIDPCIPKHWPGYQLTYRRRGPNHAITRFEITVDNSALVGSGVTRIELDGLALPASEDVALADDGRVHTLHITMGQTKVP